MPQARIDDLYREIYQVETYRIQNGLQKDNVFDSMAKQYRDEGGTGDAFEYLRAMNNRAEGGPQSEYNREASILKRNDRHSPLAAQDDGSFGQYSNRRAADDATEGFNSYGKTATDFESTSHAIKMPNRRGDGQPASYGVNRDADYYQGGNNLTPQGNIQDGQKLAANVWNRPDDYLHNEAGHQANDPLANNQLHDDWHLPYESANKVTGGQTNHTDRYSRTQIDTVQNDPRGFGMARDESMSHHQNRLPAMGLGQSMSFGGPLDNQNYGNDQNESMLPEEIYEEWKAHQDSRYGRFNANQGNDKAIARVAVDRQPQGSDDWTREGQPDGDTNMIAPFDESQRRGISPMQVSEGNPEFPGIGSVDNRAAGDLAIERALKERIQENNAILDGMKIQADIIHQMRASNQDLNKKIANMMAEKVKQGNKVDSGDPELKRLGEAINKQEGVNKNLLNRLDQVEEKMSKGFQSIKNDQEKEKKERQESGKQLEQKVLDKISQVLAEHNKGQNNKDQIPTEKKPQEEDAQIKQRLEILKMEAEAATTSPATKSTPPASNNYLQKPTSVLSQNVQTSLKKKIIVTQNSKEVSDNTRDVFLQMPDGRLGKIVSNREYDSRSPSPIQTSDRRGRYMTSSLSTTEGRTYTSMNTNLASTQGAYIYPGNQAAYCSHGGGCCSRTAMAQDCCCKCSHFCYRCGYLVPSNASSLKPGTLTSSNQPVYTSETHPQAYINSVKPTAKLTSSSTAFPLATPIDSSLPLKMVVSTAPFSPTPVTIRSNTPPPQFCSPASPGVRLGASSIGQTFSRTMDSGQLSARVASGGNQTSPVPARTINVSLQQTIESFSKVMTERKVKERSVSPIINQTPVDNPMTMAQILEEANRNFNTYNPASRYTSNSTVR